MLVVVADSIDTPKKVVVVVVSLNVVVIGVVVEVEVVEKGVEVAFLIRDGYILN